MKRVCVLRKAPAEGSNLRGTSVAFICVLLAEGVDMSSTPQCTRRILSGFCHGVNRNYTGWTTCPMDEV